ncbi:MAG: M20/M25/M40 family metallo-hydrolase [Alphaproteobacteria bacterium]|nr:M20/M25/M40 family metallo-hydrolase [Alphaproteobacteria bacterium]
MRASLISAAFLSAASLAAAIAPAAEAQLSDPGGRAAFRAIYEEMVETDSSPSTGSCTRVVTSALGRLKAAGYADAEARLVIPAGAPDDGNLVAVIEGADASAKAVLLLAHIDVVDARREDWQRDPYTLIEENGFFHGRGTADMKAQAAVFLDLMIRLKTEGFKPMRDLKLALTCGEETSNRVNGVDYLLKNHRELIDAAFALNEGARGLLSAAGKPLALQLQAGEKIHQVFVLEVTNPGGHSSRPVPDNAIYRLAQALKKVQAHQFPVQVTPVTRTYFERIGPILGGQIGAAMTAVGKKPDDQGGLGVLTSDPTYNAILRSTCVATQLDAGHAPNALPQRARATFSCRIMQGTTLEQVQAAITGAVADPLVTVSIERRRDGSNPPELTEEIMAPIRKVAARMWPGVAIAPSMTAGATDGRFLMNAGIPTYGMSGMFAIPGESNAHGLDEKIRVKSVYEGREFLEAVTRAYAGGE